MSPFRSIWCAAVAAGVLLAGPAFSPSAHAREAPPAVTPVVATALTSPAPVRASDSRVHLVYELLLTNAAERPAAIRSVEAVSASSGKVMEKLSGKDLALRFKLVGQLSLPTASADAVSLQPSQTGIVFLDVSAPRQQDLPRELVHRLALTYPEAPWPGAIPASVTETAGKVKVSSRPVPVVAPPLTGAGWTDDAGCCSEITSHRGIALPLNQSLHVPQRFAIDFYRTDKAGRFYTGAGGRLENWAGYGAPVHAAAGGTIVSAVDGLPEQTPLKAPSSGLQLPQYAGNHVVQKFQQQGYTYYAMYAHLKTGSVKALGLRPGQKITTGQQLGLLGNTGNTARPHLHFQVTDGPDQLASDGLPFQFTSFTVTGRIPSTEKFRGAFENGTPVENTAVAPPQVHRGQLPLYFDILTLPGRPPARS
ncbi:peptidoglycan DD-metalloendopeptidase family protein [Streptomyces sp. NPDC008121]|uniref:M23 family metallopeptidase n=1 Tax=Streptomyces sp. NPDC008121 TaxID=3364809 RepID=UPI0036EA6B24